MNKCEWKEGEFDPCCENIKSVKNGFDFWMDNGEWMVFENISHCPWCGGDIRKPEPEVIIRKSGGTWVLKKDGIDYLMTYQECCDFDKEEIAHMVETNWPKGWKQINDKDGNQLLEITDEIAKLRPMVITSKPERKGKLLSVINDSSYPYVIYIKGYDDVDQWVDCRLATVSDLDKNNDGGAS